MSLESRMENILKTNPIPETKGKYLAALNRLVSQGRARKTKRGYELPLQIGEQRQNG